MVKGGTMRNKKWMEKSMGEDETLDETNEHYVQQS
jgi:hypothetical protein